MSETTGGNYCLNNQKVGNLVDIGYAGQNFVVAATSLPCKSDLVDRILVLATKRVYFTVVSSRKRASGQSQLQSCPTLSRGCKDTKMIP